MSLPNRSRLLMLSVARHGFAATRSIGVFPYSLQHHQGQKAKAGTSALATLRKRTGFSLSLCKKALGKCGQDVTAARAWLEEQAQQQGWDKANRLQGRNAAQGLVGACASSAAGDGSWLAMIELNSETDFVARNREFHVLLNAALDICLEKAASLGRDDDGESGLVVRHLGRSELAETPTSDGKTLADLVALNIGLIGENIILRRAVLCKATAACGSRLSFLTHPSPANICKAGVSYGRFGAVISYMSKGQGNDLLARQLCQHVIGMNPLSLGSVDQEPAPVAPAAVDDGPCESKAKGEGEQDDEDWSHLEVQDALMASSSMELVHQPFLTNPDVTVKEVMLEADITVTNFVRFEVGENVDDDDK